MICLKILLRFKANQRRGCRYFTTNHLLLQTPTNLHESIESARSIDNDSLTETSAEQSQKQNIAGYPSKIVIEFSSPNIAKPFHVGHLRSTMIGNFLANLNEHLGNNVVRINYLGDWGTQFGLLKVGVDLCGYTEEIIKADPIQLLYNAYVSANKAAESNPAIAAEARQVFQQLEAGSLPDLERWETFRGYTVSELQGTYQRLGVRFDEYAWESSYGARHIAAVMSALQAKGLLTTQVDGKQVMELSDGRRVPVVKSDGSTLYLTRDIAAAVDRFQRHTFDRMYYAVDNAQTDHFAALAAALAAMGLRWYDRLTHVKFGRIRGMSTRKGSAVFLKDILDQAKDVMRTRQREAKTTKVSFDFDNDRTADVLGVSAVVVNDLKQRRKRDYEFSWDQALQPQGDSGVLLQYTHCRLHSLEAQSAFPPAAHLVDSALLEPSALALRLHLAAFPATLASAQRLLEPCVLVAFLFQLCRLTSRALKALRVNDQGEFLGSQRLLMFHQARLVLAQGMGILGLQPLTQM